MLSSVLCPLGSVNLLWIPWEFNRSNSWTVWARLSAFLVFNWGLGHHLPIYFAGSVTTNFTARSIQSANWTSFSTPSGSTIIQPFIARPVMSNSLTLGSNKAISP